MTLGTPPTTVSIPGSGQHFLSSRVASVVQWRSFSLLVGSLLKGINPHKSLIGLIWMVGVLCTLSHCAFGRRLV